MKVQEMIEAFLEHLQVPSKAGYTITDFLFFWGKQSNTFLGKNNLKYIKKHYINYDTECHLMYR